MLVTVFKEPVVFRSVQGPVLIISLFIRLRNGEASRAERRNCIAEDFTDLLSQEFAAAAIWSGVAGERR